MGVVVFVEIAARNQVWHSRGCGVADLVHFGFDAVVEKEPRPSDGPEIMEYTAHGHDRIVVRRRCCAERGIGVRSGTPSRRGPTIERHQETHSDRTLKEIVKHSLHAIGN